MQVWQVLLACDECPHCRLCTAHEVMVTLYTQSQHVRQIKDVRTSHELTWGERRTW